MEETIRGCKINLLMAEPGVDYTTACLRIRDNNQQKLLTSIGFIKGAVLSVVPETVGNLIVKIEENRMAIGKDIVRRIDVTIVGG